MSDFTSNFWSVYVAGLTLIGIIACMLLLWITARKKIVSSSDNTTGHVWDEDLTEMNNPMPRWWMWMFVLTTVFALGYLILYPGLGSFAGKLGWTQLGEYQQEMDKGRAEIEPLYARFASMKPEEVAGDAQAMAIGERLFMNNCAQCHGSDARGGKSFPNLTDGDWLHGGTPEKISETLHQGRVGNMPPMAEAVGNADDVRNLSHYVLSLSGSPHDSLRASLGKPKFAACAACHGMDGKGNQAL
ncbi:MAG: cytochrome-c oxidase, cbb3-type subunit III, partial [Burkholderiaceae bacterium]|nr:cytochrome-c oxidase, cbb3-type subunit III [Burkholderiaceae bacterium]